MEFQSHCEKVLLQEDLIEMAVDGSKEEALGGMRCKGQVRCKANAMGNGRT